MKVKITLSGGEARCHGNVDHIVSTDYAIDIYMDKSAYTKYITGYRYDNKKVLCMEVYNEDKDSE